MFSSMPHKRVDLLSIMSILWILLNTLAPSHIFTHEHMECWAISPSCSSNAVHLISETEREIYSWLKPVPKASTAVTYFPVPVAQWLEHCVSSAKVVGSIPREHTYWQKNV